MSSSGGAGGGVGGSDGGVGGTASSSSLLLSQPIVLDNGTATIKAGFAGSSNPKVNAKE